MHLVIVIVVISNIIIKGAKVLSYFKLYSRFLILLID